MSNNKKVVYFNHWFSSMESLISDLKARYGEDIVIVASSSNEYATYKNVADVFIKTDETVLDWLSICKRYGVEVFFCRDKFDILDDNDIKKFKQIGVDIILDKNRLIDDKAEFYRLIEDTCRFDKFPDIVIPYYSTFEGCKSKEDVMVALRDTLANLAINELTPTFKFINGEGGISYREIRVKDNTSYDSLMNPNGRILSYDDTIKLFSNMTVDESKTVMFMEKLREPEISLDCYASESLGFIAYGREKVGRQQIIIDCQNTKSTDYIEMRRFACEIAKNFNLKNPFNIQFMRSSKTGSLAILEVNNRLSGGCYMLTPLGINICDIVIKDRTDGCLNTSDIEFNTGKSEAVVARTEKPILV